ncbi:hypothetical protein A3G63_00420 [Candidatus Kaiserbacteria bacterium RIFCSPLOWO2_12_FULL_52_8]|uniref:PD-(D/E)XK endonuclease-like domain-containing protein n=1 Tax=Candidatus Kaiserbacteria bacterium RIFCSPHIGHO2_01_FULL_53_31 TaxID=1798481 RepID=A0A1F6CHG2_9BACT|nr:MAG: hypothetical protein A2678_02055 [Candidatus Kaiserbacteria bacterium RIFCSPHIGHO2_01_FULL_53_31]OGG93858.1 MAG: hypothetical protein A3G63_00420 [Candidatus Kaiserbacteria bacterium RIFCSPLOWO2_12_FULL_52_8]
MATAKRKHGKRKSKLPIEHWSHSSLMAFLRNPLAWYKRYVEKIYDTPSGPAGIIGRAGHIALQHFYSGADKEMAKRLGLEYLRSVADFEINFGKAKSVRAKKTKRAAMEKDYLQAVGFYLMRAPKHKVLGVEISGVVSVEGLALPIKAISDLVVESRGDSSAVDIVDHKFVDAFSKSGAGKPLFILQAIFNYYTVREMFDRPVRRFIVYECKKRRNADGSSQMRRYVLEYENVKEEFEVFRRLVNDATKELSSRRVFLPNPSDMFEGEDSFNMYRLRLVEE